MKLLVATALFSACAAPLPVVINPPTCYCIAHPPESAEEKTIEKKVERAVEKATAKDQEKRKGDIRREIGKLKEQAESLKGMAEESAKPKSDK